MTIPAATQPPAAGQAAHTPIDEMPLVGVTWLQMLGLSARHAKAVVRSHRAEMEQKNAALVAALEEIESLLSGRKANAAHPGQCVDRSISFARAALAQAKS